MDRSSNGHNNAATTQAGDATHDLIGLSHHHHHHHHHQQQQQQKQQQPVRERTASTNSSSTTSSSSSGSDDGDFILLDAGEFRKPIFGEPKAEGEAATAAVLPPSSLLDLGGREASDGNNYRAAAAPVQAFDQFGGEHHMHPYAAQMAPPSTGGAPVPSPTSLSKLKPPTEELEALKQPPPAQWMARAEAEADVPDPYRIPSSVFARTKSNAPMEWSVASNESLFSIHMGNNSFSTDHVFLLGKSGELPSYLNSPLDAHGNMPMDPNFPPPPPSSMIHHHHQQQPPPPPPTVGVVQSDQYGLRVESSTEQQHEKAARTISTPRHSDGSVTSIQSFAFPILTGERGGSIKVEPQLQQHHLHPQQGGAKAQQEEKPATPTTAKAANASAASWCPTFLRCTLCCRRAQGGE